MTWRGYLGFMALLAIVGCVPAGGAPRPAVEQETTAEQAAALRVRVLTSGDPAPTRPAIPTLSPTPQPLCRGAVLWHDARQHVGRRVTVEGPVVEVRHNGAGASVTALLAVGQPYADPNRFTIRLKADFPHPPAAYGQRTVCATGLVQRLAGAISMDVENPSDMVALWSGVEKDTRE